MAPPRQSLVTDAIPVGAVSGANSGWLARFVSD